MAMLLFGQDARFDAVRSIAATEVTDSFSKTGTKVGTDAAEASSTSTVINATAHAASVGDIITFTSGSLAGEWSTVTAKTANTITVSPAFSGAPSAADTFTIVTPRALASYSKVFLWTSTLDQPVTISFDGSQEDLVIPPESEDKIELKANNTQIPAGTHIYVKATGTTPTTGSLYISNVIA